MAEFDVNFEENKEKVEAGPQVDPAIIKDIVGKIAQGVEGIFPVNQSILEDLSEKIKGEQTHAGLAVELGTKQSAIDVQVIGRFGSDIPKAFDEVIALSTAEIKKETGLDLVELNMVLLDVLNEKDFDEKYGKKKPKPAPKKKAAAKKKASAKKVEEVAETVESSEVVGE